MPRSSSRIAPPILDQARILIFGGSPDADSAALYVAHFVGKSADDLTSDDYRKVFTITYDELLKIAHDTDIIEQYGTLIWSTTDGSHFVL